MGNVLSQRSVDRRDTPERGALRNDVELPTSIQDVIVTQARAHAPHECCGLLIGTAGRICDAFPVTNIAPSRRTRYAIDPVEHFAAIRQARAIGHAVIGCYHSHPAGPPLPSRTDLAEAFGQFLFVIVGLQGAEASVSAWESIEGNFVQVPLVRTP